jgi:hypothetical protein
MGKLRTILSRLGLASATAIGLSASVQTDSFAQRADELAELACKRALDAGTIEALENYLFEFPDAPTACRVLAQNTLGAFGPGGGGDPDNPGNGGYGG